MLNVSIIRQNVFRITLLTGTALLSVIDYAINAPILEGSTTCFLGDTVCSYFLWDAWTIALGLWVCLQLSWSVCLLLVQSYQIAVATTTNESANAHRYSYMNHQDQGMMAQMAAGPGGGLAGSDGPMATAGAHQHGGGHSHGAGGFCPCMQLFAGARALHKQRRSRRARGSIGGNVFDQGCWNNCVQFWSDGPDGRSGQYNWYELYDTQELQSYTRKPTRMEDV